MMGETENISFHQQQSYVFIQSSKHLALVEARKSKEVKAYKRISQKCREMIRSISKKKNEP